MILEGKTWVIGGGGGGGGWDLVRNPRAPHHLFEPWIS